MDMPYTTFPKRPGIFFNGERLADDAKHERNGLGRQTNHVESQLLTSGWAKETKKERNASSSLCGGGSNHLTMPGVILSITVSEIRQWIGGDVDRAVFQDTFTTALAIVVEMQPFKVIPKFAIPNANPLQYCTRKFKSRRCHCTVHRIQRILARLFRSFNFFFLSMCPPLMGIDTNFLYCS